MTTSRTGTRTATSRPAWRRHLVAALCTGVYAMCIVSAGLIHVHFTAPDMTCWGKGPGSALAAFFTLVLTAVGLAVLGGCWSVSVFLDTAPRARVAVMSATGLLAVLIGLAAAWSAWPPYC